MVTPLDIGDGIERQATVIEWLIHQFGQLIFTREFPPARSRPYQAVFTSSKTFMNLDLSVFP